MTSLEPPEPCAILHCTPGPGPVLFSVPHAGTGCPDWLLERMTTSARRLPDTDWFVDRLYDFVPDLGQSFLVARTTRYLVDLNRPLSDDNLYPGQPTTGLCPTVQFDGAAIYLDGEEPDAAEVDARVEGWWRPYHRRLLAELERIRSRHGYAVLFDCHSIDSRVPRLFEGTLPVLNLGTNHGVTSDPGLQERVADVLQASGYPTAVNGRFVGGAITRGHGDPARGVHALQLEIGWDGYLRDTAWDDRRAERLRAVLRAVAEVLVAWRPGVA